MEIRYLTKSRYIEGLECQTKLFYSNNIEYQNNKVDDSFLDSLSEGGYQVGELSKFLICDQPYLEDITIDTLDYNEALNLTRKKLENEFTAIAESAFLYNNLFIRVDLLKKKNNQIDFYEVKSKSWDYQVDSGKEFEIFIKEAKTGKKKGNKIINSKWKTYLYEVTFQRYIIKKLFPEMKINTNIVLADKFSKTSINGLNQFFKILKNKKVKVKRSLHRNELGKIPLKIIDVDRVCDFIENTEIQGMPFSSHIEYLSNIYKNKIRDWKKIDHNCFKCQYHNNFSSKFKSGFIECFKNSGYVINKDSKLVDRLWKATKKETDLGNFLMDQVDEKKYFTKTAEESNGMSSSYRQYVQIKKFKENNKKPYYHDSLKSVIESFEKPYHFIDFETSTLAIPFHKNRYPYESIAFQYSYHMFDGNRIEHQGEFINTEPEFPNYNFLRSLKNEFSPDFKGTIFRYHNHENTILNKIYTQLLDESSTEIPDKNELIDFIKEISQPTLANKGKWKASKNNMVDLYDLILSLYYSPYSNGSNSIKNILPSVIHDSSFLKSKYGMPIYGSELIPSKNFVNHSLLSRSNLDPYKCLPPIFENIDDYTEIISQSNLNFERIDDGGTAMIAYQFLQFSDLDIDLKTSIKKSLLKYCELDTMAMVMIFEHFLEKIK